MKLDRFINRPVPVSYTHLVWAVLKEDLMMRLLRVLCPVLPRPAHSITIKINFPLGFNVSCRVMTTFFPLDLISGCCTCGGDITIFSFGLRCV